LRAVLDPNVLISALLSARGAPAQVLRAWSDGAFDLVISESLVSELRRALAYPKLRRRISEAEAAEFVRWVEGSALRAVDPDEWPMGATHSRDPGDEYLLAVAAAVDAVLVTGDRDLLELGRDLPIHSPAGFLALIEG
jgi:putative PIN family toxin of toxin-antitoxin system